MEHLTQLENFLRLLPIAVLSLYLSSCLLLQSSVNYLGHVVHPGKLAVALKAVYTVTEMSIPKSMTEVRSFLGLCNDYLNFSDLYAHSIPVECDGKKRRTSKVWFDIRRANDGVQNVTEEANRIADVGFAFSGLDIYPRYQCLWQASRLCVDAAIPWHCKYPIGY